MDEVGTKWHKPINPKKPQPQPFIGCFLGCQVFSIAVHQSHNPTAAPVAKPFESCWSQSCERPGTAKWRKIEFIPKEVTRVLGLLLLLPHSPHLPQQWLLPLSEPPAARAAMARAAESPKPWGSEGWRSHPSLWHEKCSTQQVNPHIQ